MEQGRILFGALLDASNDYTVDNRGDVGSWVREASLLAMEKIIYMFVARDNANTEGGMKC
jgi:hypothetical protein